MVFAEGKSTNYATTHFSRNGRKVRLLMHRFILNAPRALEVDHANMNGLDNRRSNIRLCTRVQNIANYKVSSVNTSGFKGVIKETSKLRPRPWRARIRIDGKLMSLGYFNTPAEAAKAYNAKAKEVYGDFAHLNPV
jgi:hypothetical protein